MTRDGLLLAMMTESLQRLLPVPALLARELHPRRTLFGQHAVWRAALAADRLDPGIALLHDDRLLRHGFADQALGLLAHRLLRHRPLAAMETTQAYSTGALLLRRRDKIA